MPGWRRASFEELKCVSESDILTHDLTYIPLKKIVKKVFLILA